MTATSKISEAHTPLTLRAILFRITPLCLLGVVVVGLVLRLQGNGQQAANELASDVEARVLPVNVVAAVQADYYTEKRPYTGLIKAHGLVEMTFPRAGRLKRMLVDHGDLVMEGDELAELDKQHLQLQKKKLESAHEEARLALAKLMADPRLQDPRALRRSIEQLRQELDQLKTQVNAEQAGGASSATTTMRLQAAQRNLDTFDALTRQQVEAQRQVVADLEAQLAEVDVELKESMMRAPFDGVIALRYVGVGALVAPSRPVLRIVEWKKLEAWVAVPLAVAAEFTYGKQYMLDVDGQQYPAEVQTVLPEVDRSTRSRTVILTLNERASGQLSPGEVFQLTLARQVQGRGYWLPLSALTRQTRGLWSAYVVQRDEAGIDRVARRYVEVIHLDGERAWVRGMLDHHERVVANGTHRIVEGQRVKTSDEPESTPPESISIEEVTP